MKFADSSAPAFITPQTNISSFDKHLSELKLEFMTMWQTTSDEFYLSGKEYSEEKQRAMMARVEETVAVDDDIDPTSNDAMLRLQHLKSSVRAMVVRSMDPGLRDETNSMLQDFSVAGDEFVSRARTFDPELSPDDMFQALRNLWIINSMQAGFGRPVKVTPSGVAYSLLYPYMDNFLDGTASTYSERRAFSRRFKCRLLDMSVRPSSACEAKMWALVEMVESEFPRFAYPDVYRSLLAIHHAQERSLLQHASRNDGPRPDLLDISVEKGGTSVLADAFLVKGDLTNDEARFSFGYGVFLQFIDDLQDVEEDLRRCHQTLFTMAASRGQLYLAANRLHRFVEHVLASTASSMRSSACTLTELVRRSCRYLILESIAKNPGLFDEEYSGRVERFSPVRFADIRRLHEKIRSKRRGLRKVLKRGRGFQQQPVKLRRQASDVGLSS